MAALAPAHRDRTRSPESVIADGPFGFWSQPLAARHARMCATMDQMVKLSNYIVKSFNYFVEGQNHMNGEM
jgi:hypothetical protein